MIIIIIISIISIISIILLQDISKIVLWNLFLMVLPKSDFGNLWFLGSYLGVLDQNNACLQVI